MNNLTPRELSKAKAQFASAVIALTNCWDSLHELETLLGVEIETDDIQTFASNDDWSEEAFNTLFEQLKEKEEN